MRWDASMDVSMIRHARGLGTQQRTPDATTRMAQVGMLHSEAKCRQRQRLMQLQFNGRGGGDGNGPGQLQAIIKHIDVEDIQQIHWN